MMKAKMEHIQEVKKNMMRVQSPKRAEVLSKIDGVETSLAKLDLLKRKVTMVTR
jgi:hypothetical protein